MTEEVMGASFGPGCEASPSTACGVLAESHPSRSNAAYLASVQTDPENREANDFYPTHPGATRALLAVEPLVGGVWEPACGEGDISRVLESLGHEVVSTDLIDRGYGESRADFLMEWEPRAPNIITNPPFKLAREFVDHALAMTTGKVAMFLRLAFLEGVDRGGWFPGTPLARVWVMSRRVPMWRGEVRDEIGSLMAMAWFVWDHAHSGPPSIGWLDWKDHCDSDRSPQGGDKGTLGSVHESAGREASPDDKQGSLFGEAA